MFLSLQLDCKYLEGRASPPFRSLMMPRRVICIREGWDRRRAFCPGVVHSPAELTVCTGEFGPQSVRGPRLLSFVTYQGDCDAGSQGRQNQQLGSRVGICLCFQGEVQAPRHSLRSGPHVSSGRRTWQRNSLGEVGSSVKKTSRQVPVKT